MVPLAFVCRVEPPGELAFVFTWFRACVEPQDPSPCSLGVTISLERHTAVEIPWYPRSRDLRWIPGASSPALYPLTIPSLLVALVWLRAHQTASAKAETWECSFTSGLTASRFLTVDCAGSCERSAIRDRRDRHPSSIWLAH